MLGLAQLRRRPWFRVAKWLGGGLFGAYLLYVVLAAAFLSFGGLAWATETEEDIHVEVASGYSLIPGRVHLRGLKIRVKDYNIEMEIRADSAVTSLALRKLPWKQLDVAWVRVAGVEYRLVHRVVDPVASAARLAVFPPIPGFTRPRYYDAPKEPPTEKKLWTVRFRAIEAEVKLAWLLEYQVRGKLHARGGFYLDPGKEAQVFPCRVEVETAEIFVGEERIATDVRGIVSAEVETFDARNAATIDVIPKISATIEHLSAALETLSFTGLYVRSERVAWSGKGQLGLDLRVTKGQLQAGSTAMLVLDPVTVQAGGVRAQGKGTVDVRAGAAGGVESEASFSFPKEERRPVSLELLELQASLEHEVITDVTVRSARLRLERLHFAGPEFLRGILGNTAAIPMSGAFDANALLDLPRQGRSRLDVEVATRGTSFYLSGLRFGVTGDGVVSCQGTRAEAECQLDARAPYLLFDQQPGKGGATLWLTAKVQEPLRVSIDQGTLMGNVHLQGGDPKEVVSELVGEDWLAQLGLTLVPTGPIAGTLELNRSPAVFSVRGDVSSGSSNVQGHLHAREVTSGAWVVDMPTNRWGFQLNSAGLTTFPLVGGDWLAAH
jgi:hypothetical protein